MSGYAPIVLFTYNRLKNTRETIDGLLANSEAAFSDLIVYSDAPKKQSDSASVDEVRGYLKTVSGFQSVTIIEREYNYGLVRNIISGVTQTVNQYGRVIVLEDDLSVSPFYLKYVNEGLNQFEGRKDIVSLNGYMYPHRSQLPEVFLVKGADCLGWATWKRGWDIFREDAAGLYDEIVRQKREDEFDFKGTYPYMQMLRDKANGRVSSWAICWYASAFLANMYTVYPNESMVRLNSIFDECEHSSPSPYMLNYVVKTKTTPIDWSKGQLVEESKEARRVFERFFRSLKSLPRKVYLKLMFVFGRRYRYDS